MVSQQENDSSLKLPSSFPDREFRDFGLAAQALFPKLLSDEDLSDPLQQGSQFMWAWQAVRYRYRLCFSCCQELKELPTSELWDAGCHDEEVNYAVERCLYTFFMSASSLFDSLAYCLYFAGHRLDRIAFPDVTKPHKIDLKTTTQSFRQLAPGLCSALEHLENHEGFKAIRDTRNIVGHRLSGRRTRCTKSKLNADGTAEHQHRDTWHHPGQPQDRDYTDHMLDDHLADMAELLKSIIDPARECFASAAPKADDNPGAEPQPATIA